MSESVDSAGDALVALQKSITDSQATVKNLASSMRLLKGASDDVKSAKEELRGKIQAEQAAITKNNLALLKAGSSYESVTTSIKKTAAQQEKLKNSNKDADPAKLTEKTDKLGKAINAIGGPIASAKSHLSSLKDLLANAGGASGLATLAVVGFTAAIAALATAAIVGVYSVARWILEVGNARRTAGLFREAALGSAQGAKDLGAQIDALAQKVSTPKEKINELAVSLSKMRLSGKAIVDTLNLVTQASDAMGDDVGKKLEDVITRSQLTGRVGLNPMELLGTNVEFDEVAKNLAEQMHTGVAQARKQLLLGRAPLEDAAAALRKTVEKKFGAINLRKMLDLNVIGAKLKETLANLTSGVNLEPALRAIADLAKMFDKSTITGSALKTMVTLIGDGMVKLFVDGAPYAKAAFNGMMIAALSTVLAFLKLRNAWRDITKDNDFLSGMLTTEDVMRGAEVAVYALVGALVIAGAAVALVAAPFVAAALAVVQLVDAVVDAYDYLGGIDWAEAGGNIVSGLVAGIKSKIPDATGIIGGLADSIAKSFTDRLKIASPSRLFATYGRNTVEGYEQGVDDAAPGAQAAVDSMAPTMTTGANASSSGAASIDVGGITIQIYADGAKDPQAIADAVKAPSTIAALLKALNDALATGELTPAT